MAEPCGFCFGANRSIEQAEKAGKAYSLGPILHNEILVEKLKAQGIEPETYDGIISSRKHKKVIIRAHGVPIHQINGLKENGFEVIDGTCPKVKNIYNITSCFEAMDYQVIVFGNNEHAEVLGIASRLTKPIIVKDKNNLAQKYEKACIVSQTTQRKESYDEIKHIISRRSSNFIAFDTICSETRERQEAASSLANNVELMVVIGGKQSSNTKKLYDVCKSVNEKTYLIQNKYDLDGIILNGGKKAGITAGASTPDFLIDEIVEELRKY